MIYFECDYHEGAHPEILKRLCDTNLRQTMGYGVDEHCENARRLIRNACGRQDADVHFLVGGTQTNTTVIAAVLKPYQGVICATSGHINVHETGAIESTGHKVLPVETKDGKISAVSVRSYIEAHYDDASFEHIVQPGMVYISHPTESGTLYTKSELSELFEVCREYSIPLFIDGARLGYGLCAESTDLELCDIASLCDVFYIGGTKVGALFGEAVVITGERYKKDFRYMIKQRGGMLAKGRLLGIQFETLFENGLYFDISRHAIRLAYRIRAALRELGVEMLFESDTNQQFPIFDDDILDTLRDKYEFCYWQRVSDTRSAVRICTSWATKEENVDLLIEDLKRVLG